ncbi:PLP-dependent aminotransferase family protein [Acetobacter sp. DmW_136]|uniref:MocR-like pyridoxine biosynthesis transcription factor PdxR n=1 Tax=Acetobacter sp. DmW_136 TaxID=2591091 RepID=UPI00123B8EBA|nr:PLP-dependent aminotransferase family protein [Acetobacter sp. DmW_136]KAA8384088.1 PLP-dependent aminotransferase family protein [Acetobacter sp. DmW_136]
MSARHEFTIELIGDPTRAVYLDLAESIIREIERGRLKPGQILPGTRALSRTLGVHRNTVDAAYHELTMQGWLIARSSQGTFVADDLPVADAIPAQKQTPVKKNIPSRTMKTQVLRVSDGTPDPRIMPRNELARAFRSVLTSSLFLSSDDYADPRGSSELRAALANEFLNARGLSVSADDLLITHGSQMALFLAASVVLRTGDSIAVENPGYPFAWACFRAAGARTVGIPVDEDGIDVDYLERLIKRDGSIKAVYVTPHHQYPTTVTLGAGRRLKLLEIARRHDLVIIEDDYDHEYRFDSHPVLPLAARARPDQRLIHIGSLSKLTAPALRLGYVIAAPDILNRMVHLREIVDRQGDVPLEQALAHMITSGLLARHARKARRIYATRRDFFIDEVRKYFGNLIEFTVPAGGLAVWLRVDNRIDVRVWAKAAEGEGLRIASGERFSLDGKLELNCLRFGYAHLNEDEIHKTLTILRSSLSSSDCAELQIT